MVCVVGCVFSAKESVLLCMPGFKVVYTSTWERVGKLGQWEKVYMSNKTKCQTMQNDSCQKYYPRLSPTPSKKLSYDSILC